MYVYQLLAKRPWMQYVVHFLVILLSGLGLSLSLNVFYQPSGIYTEGMNGLTQLITHFTDQTALRSLLTPTNIYYIINIPLIIIGYRRLGKFFTYGTLAVITSQMIWAQIIPVIGISNNILLNTVIGGVIRGLAIGLSVKFGMSGGGMDIIAVMVAKATGMNVGSMSLLLNSFVILAAAYLSGVEYALYSLIALFIMSQVLDAVHTNEERLTAFIVTKDEEAMIHNIHQHMARGITCLDGKGGYSGEERNVLMIVVSRYELYTLEMAIYEVDPNAFVNIIRSHQIIGPFWSQEEQKQLLK